MNFNDEERMYLQRLLESGHFDRLINFSDETSEITDCNNAQTNIEKKDKQDKKIIITKLYFL